MTPEEARALRAVDPAQLGARIRDLRLAGKLTQGGLAGSDMSVGYVSRIEAGQRRPDSEKLEIIAARLQVSVAELVRPIGESAGAARLQLRFAELALESGDFVEAQRSASEWLADPNGLASDELRADATYVLARALEGQGQLREAISEYARLQDPAKAGGRWLAAMLGVMRCCRECGDVSRAITVGEAALVVLSTVGLEETTDYVQVLVGLAAACFEVGEEERAFQISEDAVARAEALGDRKARATTYWAVSVVESASGHQSIAIAWAERALALMSKGEDDRSLARLRAQLGAMMLRTDSPKIDEAERLLVRARSDCVESGAGVIDLARIDIGLASARLLAGDTSEAARLANAAIVSVETSTPLLSSAAHIVIGRSRLLDGDREGAVASYRSAAADLTAAGADRGAAQAWFELATLLDEVGETQAAAAAYRSAGAAAGLKVTQPSVLKSRATAR
ncbi:MAG TPA: helix-turn-helix transcriptional regulator [Mycobacteriales bacterium]|nr:helix-turn-helix transcriptional regulator [Mycobacteriales bacterium]